MCVFPQKIRRGASSVETKSLETRLLKSFSESHVETWAHLHSITIDNRPSDLQCQGFRGLPLAQRIFETILLGVAGWDSCLVGLLLGEPTCEFVRQLLELDNLTRETARHADGFIISVQCKSQLYMLIIVLQGTYSKAGVRPVDR